MIHFVLSGQLHAYNQPTLFDVTKQNLHTGSGIYSGKAGALVSTMPGVPTTRLMVARVPKVPGEVILTYKYCEQCRMGLCIGLMFEKKCLRISQILFSSMKLPHGKGFRFVFHNIPLCSAIFCKPCWNLSKSFRHLVRYLIWYLRPQLATNLDHLDSK